MSLVGLTSDNRLNLQDWQTHPALEQRPLRQCPSAFLYWRWGSAIGSHPAQVDKIYSQLSSREALRE